MENYNQPYTLGTWSIKPSKEVEFISVWKSFAELTSRKFPNAGTGYLLQDYSNPSHFISFGSWDNEQTIESWRKLPEFKQFVETIKNLCESFQPNNMHLVATSKG